MLRLRRPFLYGRNTFVTVLFRIEEGPDKMEITRRDLLLSAGGVASGLTAGASGLNEAGAHPLAPQNPTPRKMKVVVCGGHPGDPEYGCGGAVARLTALGHEVVLLYLNNGEWPPTPAATRQAEAAKACEILKARPAYAGQVNGHAVVDPAHYDAYQQLIAAENPDAVLTQWPIDNHPDHRAISMLTYNAWKKLGKKFALYYYEVSNGKIPCNSRPIITLISLRPRRKAGGLLRACQPKPR